MNVKHAVVGAPGRRACSDHPAPAPTPLTAARLLVVVGALLVACLPLEDLSSYDDDGSQQLEAAPPGGLPGAATGASTTVVERPLFAAPEAGPVLTAADSERPDATPTREVDPSFGFGPLEPATEADCSAADELLDPVDQVCYRLSTNAVSWPTAAFACRASGGDLVAINSEREHRLVVAWLPATVWTGANDRSEEGTFSWQGGDAFSFSNFAEGEPNNFAGRQDCVEVQLSDGSWHDRDCGVRNRYVCERSLS